MRSIKLHIDHTPFSLAEQLVFRWGLVDEDDRGAVRFISLAPPGHRTSVNDQQSAKHQFRWKGNQASLGLLRECLLTSNHVPTDGIDLVVNQFPGHADCDFLSILSECVPISLRINSFEGKTNAEPPSGRQLGSLRRRGDWDFCSRKIADSEAWTDFRRRLAVYLQAGDSWTATWLARRALSHAAAPPTPEALDACSKAFEAHNDALAAFAILELGPRRNDSLQPSWEYSRAMLLTRHLPRGLRDPGRALEMLENTAGSASKDAIDSAINANARALLLGQSGKSATAIDLLHRAIEDLSNLPQPEPAIIAALYCNLGRLHSLLNEFDRAFDDFQKARSHDPGSPEIVAPFAKSRLDAGDALGALSLINEFESAYALNATLVHTKAVALETLGNKTEAARAFEAAARLDPLSFAYCLDAARSAVLTQAHEARVLLDRASSSNWHTDSRVQPPTIDDLAEAALLKVQWEVTCGHLPTADVGLRLESLSGDPNFGSSRLLAGALASWSADQESDGDPSSDVEETRGAI